MPVKRLITAAFVCALLAPTSSKAQRGRVDSTQSNTQSWICVTVGRRGSIGVRSSGVPFNDEAALRVEIEDPSHVIPESSWPDIVDSERTAMTTWRWACHDCSTANLGLLEIRGDLYILPPLQRALLFANNETEWRKGYNFSPAPSPDQGGSSANSMFVGSVTTDGFDSSANVVWLGWFENALNLAANPRSWTSEPHVLVADREALVGHACSLSRERLPDFMQRVQDALNCSEQTRPRRLRARSLYILVIPSNTSCGLSKNIIGCEADGSLVELNARDYSFTTTGVDGRVLFGAGEIKIDFSHVMLHELGHWIGLPHLTDPDDLMASSLEKSKCITSDTMTRLSQLLGGPWKPGTKQAFQYKDSAARSAEHGEQK